MSVINKPDVHSLSEKETLGKYYDVSGAGWFADASADVTWALIGAGRDLSLLNLIRPPRRRISLRRNLKNFIGGLDQTFSTPKRSRPAELLLLEEVWFESAPTRISTFERGIRWYSANDAGLSPLANVVTVRRWVGTFPVSSSRFSFDLLKRDRFAPGRNT